MAESPGWGPGYPSCPAKSRLVVVRAPVSGARFLFDFRIAELWSLLLNAMELGKGGPAYICDPSQCGSYVCRKIAGTNRSSSHSIGTTGDLNWRRNPMRLPLTEDIPKWVRGMFARYGFNLGRDFRPTPDPMHFSPRLDPDGMLGMLHRARKELGGPGPPPVGRPTLRRGDNEPAVAEVQRLLGITVDGDYGPATENAVRDFQHKHGLKPADGICGPTMWTALLQEDDFMAALSDDQQRELYNWVKEGLDRPYDYRNAPTGVENPENNLYGHGMATRRTVTEELSRMKDQLGRIEKILSGLQPRTPSG